MERSNFRVDAKVLVSLENDPDKASKEVLVPLSLLKLADININEVIGLEYQTKTKNKCLPLEALNIKLDQFYIHDKDENNIQTIFAHAIAICKHQRIPEAPLGVGIIQHSTDDQFFFLDTSKGQGTQYAKRDSKIEVFSLNTAASGFLEATCLSFFPHYKVGTSFKWDAADGTKIDNEVGQYFTTGQRSWVMSWAPEGTSKSTPHLCIFGRNMHTRYSGVVPMEKLLELNPLELEKWRCENAFPILPVIDRSHVRVSCEHPHGEDCLADGGVDVVERFKQEKFLAELETSG